MNFSLLTPWKGFVRSSVICGLLAAICFGLGLRRIQPPSLNQLPLKFKAENAYNYMRYLSKSFPNRVPWEKNHTRAATWLKSELLKLGYTPKSLPFSEVIAGKQYTGLENIYAEKLGTTHPDEIIVVMAHYDITDTTVEGAMDDASGVGTVLELARTFAKENTERTLLFLLTDSEEFGAFWGATAFAKSYSKAEKIIAALNFDFVAPEHQTGILTLCDGLKTGYTPLWLREIALESLRSLGTTRVADLVGIEEHIERAMQIPPADHGAFLAEGIPAFNWVGQTDNFAHVMAHYHHTPHDVAEALHVESFDSFGRGAERVIRTIDELQRIPGDFREHSYWKVSPHYYIQGWIVTLLHILAFIPFLSYSLMKFSRAFRSLSRAHIVQVTTTEAKSIGILFGSLLLGYVTILLLAPLRVITQYEIFPATQKSLLLYTPNFVAIILVITLVLSIHWILKKIFFERADMERSERETYFEVRHAVHAAVLAGVIFLAFLKNSYLAVLLLLPPAYFWIAIKARKRPEDRILNTLLLLGGSITFIAIAVVLSTIFHVGVVYWYLFLSAAYGLISAYSVVLFFMALTVMIRLFRSFVL